MEKIKLVIGVIGADVHAVGNRILDYAYTKADFDVINLGVMVSQKEFVEAAIESNADAIVVSSLYGHGEIDCRGLRNMCDEAGLKDIKLYVGGNITVGKSDFTTVEETFEKMGYDRVYPPSTSPNLSILDIKLDLNHINEEQYKEGVIDENSDR